MRDFSPSIVSPLRTSLLGLFLPLTPTPTNHTMIEFIIATAILVGKADIAPDKVQYEFLHEDGTITSVVRTVYPTN